MCYSLKWSECAICPRLYYIHMIDNITFICECGKVSISGDVLF